MNESFTVIIGTQRWIVMASLEIVSTTCGKNIHGSEFDLYKTKLSKHFNRRLHTSKLSNRSCLAYQNKTGTSGTFTMKLETYESDFHGHHRGNFGFWHHWI